MFFFPVGGFFIFGTGSSPTAKIVMGVFNLAMGGLMLGLGYLYHLWPLIIIGYVVAGLGLVTLIYGLLSGGRKKGSSSGYESTSA